MNKALKFRIYPTKEQQILLAKTFGCCRFIYNKMLADKISYYEKTGKSLQNTPAQYKEEFEWLKEVDSLALANAQMNLQTAYKNFFKNKSVGFPKFKSKKSNKFSYTTNSVNNNIKIIDSKIILPKVGKVIIKLHRDIPKNYNLKSCTVSKNPSGKYFVSILFEYDNQIVNNLEIKNGIGLDFSMYELYKDSNGNEPNFPHYYRQAESKLAREQKKLSHCQKSSKNRDKQRIKVAKLHEKVVNQRKDFLHKQSRKLVNNFDFVCIEDLNMKAMSQSLNFGKSVSDNGWGMFVTFLSYKLQEENKQLVKISRWFPSSQACNNCGCVHDFTKDLSVRFWTCPDCSHSHDRDENAAKNILMEGKRLLSI